MNTKYKIGDTVTVHSKSYSKQYTWDEFRRDIGWPDITEIEGTITGIKPNDAIRQLVFEVKVMGDPTHWQFLEQDFTTATKFKVGDRVREVSSGLGTVKVVLPSDYAMTRFNPAWTKEQCYLVSFDNSMRYITNDGKISSTFHSLVIYECELTPAVSDYRIGHHKVIKTDNKVFVGCQEINPEWVKCARTIVNNNGEIKLSGVIVTQKDINHLSELVAGK